MAPRWLILAIRISDHPRGSNRFQLVGLLDTRKKVQPASWVSLECSDPWASESLKPDLALDGRAISECLQVVPRTALKTPPRANNPRLSLICHLKVKLAS